MAEKRTAYRWNVNGWFFRTVQISEDPDFPGEFNLPSRSTWNEPPEDTETQWAKINTETGNWELADISMEDRLAEGLITQAEYDAWAIKKDGVFFSVLKARAKLDAENIVVYV